MGKNGKLLNLNSDSPKYGNKSLVTKEQENELGNKAAGVRARKISLELGERLKEYRKESVKA